MNPKIQPGGKGRAQYLIRCAFRAAEEGDAFEAMHYWNTAIGEGYILKERTHRQLLFRIREGESSRLDPATEPATPAARPPIPADVDISQRIARARRPDPAE